MTNHPLRTLLVGLFTLALFTACNNGDDDDQKTRTEILTTPSCWKWVGEELFDPVNGVWLESTVPNCDKDDCLRFYTDGVLTIDEGVLLCEVNDPPTIEGTWELSADENAVQLTYPGFSVLAPILELSETRLVVEIAIPGFKARYTYEN